MTQKVEPKRTRENLVNEGPLRSPVRYSVGTSFRCPYSTLHPKDSRRLTVHSIDEEPLSRMGLVRNFVDVGELVRFRSCRVDSKKVRGWVSLKHSNVSLVSSFLPCLSFFFSFIIVFSFLCFCDRQVYS